MATVEVPLVSRIPLDIVELRSKRRESALTQLATAAQRLGVVRDLDVLFALLSRTEKLGSTAIGKGVAVAHARSVAVARPHLLLGRAPRGIEWSAADEQPVQIVVLVLSPADHSLERHLDRVARAAQAVRQQRARLKLVEADAAAALAVLEGAPA